MPSNDEIVALLQEILEHSELDLFKLLRLAILGALIADLKSDKEFLPFLRKIKEETIKEYNAQNNNPS